MYEHQHDLNDGFTKRYQLHKLLYYEAAPTAMTAIIREKQLKHMLRAEKLALIRSLNTELIDLPGELA